MRKLYPLLLLTAGALCAPQMSAVIADDPTPKVVFEEDFSLVPAIVPWQGQYMKVFATNDTENLHPEFFHQDGWKGMNIGYGFEAGELYLAYQDDVYLQTPILELSADGGKVTVTFEYRREDFGGTSTTDNVYVELRDRANGMDKGITGIYSHPVQVNTQWKQYSITLEGGTADCSVRFWEGSYMGHIRNIKVLQVRPELDVPVVDSFTDFTGDSFTAHWREVEGAEHYLLSLFTVENGERDYVFADQKVSDTHYAVTDLDPSQIYHYTVKAVKGNTTSDESEVMRCFGISKPSINGFVNIGEEGFDVAWDPAYNATQYQLEVNLEHTAPADETYCIVDEDFLNTPGQEYPADNPASNGATSMWLDDYMNRSNWLVKMPVFAGDCLGLNNIMASMGIYGELDSPTMDLSADGGKITIEMRVRALNAASMGLYMLNEVEKVNQFTSDKIVDRIELWDADSQFEPITESWTNRTFTLTGGNDKSYIAIQAYGYGAVLQIDRIAIYQELKEGQKISIPYRSVITSDNTATISTNGEGFNQDNDKFVCKVRGAYTGNETDGVLYSDWSNDSDVSIPTATGIEIIPEDAKAADIDVTVNGGRIVVENPTSATINIFNMKGVLLMKSDATHFSTPVLPAGIYIVGNKKVLVK